MLTDGNRLLRVTTTRISPARITITVNNLTIFLVRFFGIPNYSDPTSDNGRSKRGKTLPVNEVAMEIER